MSFITLSKTAKTPCRQASDVDLQRARAIHARGHGWRPAAPRVAATNSTRSRVSMRPLLFAVAIALPLFGCTNTVNSPDMMDALLTCNNRCPSCPQGTVCATGTGGFNEHEATCLKPCQTQRDCPDSMRCAFLYSEDIGTPVCISATVPARCPNRPYDPGWHCDFPPSHCQDAMILVAPFSEPLNRTCGVQYVYCPRGCEAPPGDAYLAARCAP